jgi:hypothetical protein
LIRGKGLSSLTLDEWSAAANKTAQQMAQDGEESIFTITSFLQEKLLGLHTLHREAHILHCETRWKRAETHWNALKHTGTR